MLILAISLLKKFDKDSEKLHFQIKSAWIAICERKKIDHDISCLTHTYLKLQKKSWASKNKE